MEFWQAVPVALVTALITSLVTVAVAERKLRRDFRLEYAAETVAKQLMQHKDWRLRSFGVIKHHLGGFADDELRQILVRAGAIRFTSKSGNELWGLLERTQDMLGTDRINDDPHIPDGPSAANQK